MIHLILLADAVTTCANGSSDICHTGLPAVPLTSGSLRTILQIVFGALAALAVLMVAIGGLRYTMSEGNPEGTKQARGTILFAIIGLVIALSAEAIVSFLLGGVN